MDVECGARHRFLVFPFFCLEKRYKRFLIILPKDNREIRATPCLMFDALWLRGDPTRCRCWWPRFLKHAPGALSRLTLNTRPIASNEQIYGGRQTPEQACCQRFLIERCNKLLFFNQSSYVLDCCG